MNKASRRKTLRLGTQAAELMFASPQVVAHRLARMTAVGAGSSLRDQREFHQMSAEKFEAFGESWSQMAFQMLKANQQMARALMVAPWFSVRAMPKTVRSKSLVARQMQNSALQIISSGLAPIHRRAVANAKRLRRTKI